MQRAMAATEGDLLPAGGAIRHHQRLFSRLAQRRQEVRLRHGAGYGLGLRLIAESAGHAAAGGFDHLNFELRYPFKKSLKRCEGVKGLLVTMPVKERPMPSDRLERQGKPARRQLRRKVFLE